MNIIHLHRIAYWLYSKKIIYYLQFLLFNSSVPYQTYIGKGTVFAYGGIGVVIHARAKIGNNCIIGQGITIGGRSKKHGVPKIGNNVYIGAGARILGDIVIGDDVIIGPNAVVLKDIPSNCIAVGIPAKIIKTNIKMRDYV